MKNKKVKNANPLLYNGVLYKSRLEVMIKKTLDEKNIKSDYEKVKFLLSPCFKPTVPFYNRTAKKSFHLRKETVKSVTYTPDFTFWYGDTLVIIEGKGFETDAYRIKRQLFRTLLETPPYSSKSIIVFEIKTKSELLQALDILSKKNSKQ